MIQAAGTGAMLTRIRRGGRILKNSGDRAAGRRSDERNAADPDLTHTAGPAPGRIAARGSAHAAFAPPTETRI